MYSNTPSRSGKSRVEFSIATHFSCFRFVCACFCGVRVCVFARVCKCMCCVYELVCARVTTYVVVRMRICVLSYMCMFLCVCGVRVHVCTCFVRIFAGEYLSCVCVCEHVGAIYCQYLGTFAPHRRTKLRLVSGCTILCAHVLLTSVWVCV